MTNKNSLFGNKITKRSDNILKELPFEITTSPIKSEALEKISDNRMKEYHGFASKTGANYTRKIKEGIEKYPDIPQLYNYLYASYSMNGKNKKATQTLKKITKKFPDYLFGHISLAESKLNADYDEIPKILGEELELNKKDPKRKVFHASEVDAFYSIVGIYYCRIGDLQKAERCSTILTELGYMMGGLNRLLYEIGLFGMKKMMNRHEADKKREVLVEVIPKVIGEQRTKMSILNHELCKELYKHEDDIPTEIISEIKKLPKETLVQDLVNMLIDSILCFDYIDNENDGDEDNDASYYFPLHALYLLADVDDGSRLQNVLDFFRQEEDFMDFWLGDHFYDYEAYFVKFGYEKLNEIESFIREPNVWGIAKSSAIKSITVIALHDNEKKEEIIKFHLSLFEYFYENRENKNLLDTQVLLALIDAFVKLSDSRANDIISKFFEMGIIPHSMYGDCEKTLKSIANNKERNISPKYISYEDFLSREESFDFEDDDFDDKKSIFSKKSQIEEEIYVPDDKPKVGRNEPCPCGSGKKYKKCCLNK